MSDEQSGASAFDKAKDAAGVVSDTVQSTARKVSDAIEAGRRPGAPLDLLAEWTRDAPIHAVLIAFLLGWIAGRPGPSTRRKRQRIARP